MTRTQVAIPHDALADFCRRNAIERLSLYGSVLRDGFGPESDIDVLIEFEPDAEPSLFDLGRMQQELCDLFGRQVDLKTKEFLSPPIYDRVMQEAWVQYAA